MTPLFLALAVLLVGGLLLLLRTRRFYFVRHGETLLNEQHIRQGVEGSLSEKGKKQAAQIGAYLAPHSIDLIISSSYDRARETAEIIKTFVHARVVTSPLLVERKSPSEIVGKPSHDPEVHRITDTIDLAYHDDDYRFSDEENFVELHARATKCLALLARQGASDTVIVTHHVFLKMLISTMLYHARLHASDFVKVSYFNYADNGNITICEFNPLKRFSATKGWTVLAFNQPAT